MRDTSGVTQCSGHKVCVCQLQLCQTGTEYLENCYWDQQSGEKQTKICTDMYWSLSKAWGDYKYIWCEISIHNVKKCHFRWETTLFFINLLCSYSLWCYQSIHCCLFFLCGGNCYVWVKTTLPSTVCCRILKNWFLFALVYYWKQHHWSEIIQMFFTHK